MCSRNRNGYSHRSPRGGENKPDALSLLCLQSKLHIAARIHAVPSGRFCPHTGIPCSSAAPTNGKSTGDVLPQYSGSPHHIYSLPSALRFTDLTSAPNDSILDPQRVIFQNISHAPPQSSLLQFAVVNRSRERNDVTDVGHTGQIHTQRSNPSPNPACLAEPYFLRSR